LSTVLIGELESLVRYCDILWYHNHFCCCKKSFCDVTKHRQPKFEEATHLLSQVQEKFSEFLNVKSLQLEFSKHSLCDFLYIVKWGKKIFHNVGVKSNYPP